MARFTFQYSERNTGVIIVEADNEAQAYELAQCGEGDIHINKSEWEIGETIK